VLGTRHTRLARTPPARRSEFDQVQEPDQGKGKGHQPDLDEVEETLWVRFSHSLDGAMTFPSGIQVVPRPRLAFPNQESCAPPANEGSGM